MGREYRFGVFLSSRKELASDPYFQLSILPGPLQNKPTLWSPQHLADFLRIVHLLM